MLDYTHIEALLAVEQEGSFEGAGRVLRMSPIGVARRIKKLENRMGTILLKRKPTRPSEAGTMLCRYAEKVIALEEQFINVHHTTGLQSATDISNIKIAINDDSLSSWFLPVLQSRSSVKDLPLFDVSIVNQDHSIDLMKSGDVVAALSGYKTPIHGFKTIYLGRMTYRAIASPGFMEHYFKDGVTLDTISETPSLRCCNQDGLLLQWLQEVFGTTTRVRTTRLPSSKAFIDACCKGTAWGMLPEFQIKEELANGLLKELLNNTPLHKNLYWHVSSALAESIADVTASVRSAARILQ